MKNFKTIFMLILCGFLAFAVQASVPDDAKTTKAEYLYSDDFNFVTTFPQLNYEQPTEICFAGVFKITGDSVQYLMLNDVKIEKTYYMQLPVYTHDRMHNSFLSYQDRNNVYTNSKIFYCTSDANKIISKPLVFVGYSTNIRWLTKG